MPAAIPSLKSHRTATTLCVPEPSFHDVARHIFVLRQGFPVQRHLLAAFTGSWVGHAGVPGSGSVPFELWRRYYYPNARDQLVAKVCNVGKSLILKQQQQKTKANSVENELTCMGSTCTNAFETQPSPLSVLFFVLLQFCFPKSYYQLDSQSELLHFFLPRMLNHKLL